MKALAAIALGAALAAEPPATRWDQRLESLYAAHPMEYFELAEEVADAATDEAELALARRLHLLAWEAAETHGAASAPEALPAGVCLALADLSPDAAERRWLLALAAAASPTSAPALERSPGPPTADSGAFAVAEALGLLRAGEYKRAQAALEPRARQELLTDSGVFRENFGRHILRTAQTTPNCTECRNRRIVRTGADAESGWKLCTVCGGNPGPSLTVAEMLAHMAAESLLLRSAPESWTAQAAIDPSPTRPLDREEVARSLGVDLSATIYRDGRWIDPAFTPSP